jgi:hypothetical protein
MAVVGCWRDCTELSGSYDLSDDVDFDFEDARLFTLTDVSGSYLVRPLGEMVTLRSG